MTRRTVVRNLTMTACLTASFAATGCGDLVAQNVVAGLRDGAITATTGVIDGFFDRRFDGDDQGEEGNDLFVRP